MEVKKESVLVNEELMEEAFKIGAFQTKEALLNKMLADYLERQKKMAELVNSFGTIEYDNNYNYKVSR